MKTIKNHEKNNPTDSELVLNNGFIECTIIHTKTPQIIRILGKQGQRRERVNVLWLMLPSSSMLAHGASKLIFLQLEVSIWRDDHGRCVKEEVDVMDTLPWRCARPVSAGAAKTSSKDARSCSRWSNGPIPPIRHGPTMAA